METGKVTIIGSGRVGTAVALYVAEKRVGLVQLLDPSSSVAVGQALDLDQAYPLRRYHISVRGFQDPSCLEGSDVVIIAGGDEPPDAGPDSYVDTIDAAADMIRRHAGQARVIVALRPVIEATARGINQLEFPRQRVLGAMTGGTAGILRRRLADELGVFGADVVIRSVGGEGKAAVPLPCYCTVNGIPMTELLSYETVQDLVSPVPEPGDDYPCDYSLAASVADMVECIVRDRKRILTAAVMLDGEYGRRGSCAAVPVILGTHGAEKIIELHLLPEERLHFDRVMDRMDTARG